MSKLKWTHFKILTASLSLDSNTLTVSASVDNLENYHGSGDLYEVRFEVTNGAKLIWETNVEFNGPYGEDVNGGGIFVGEGSTVHFLNDLEMTEVGVASVREYDSDYSKNARSGGCVYTEGNFMVDGDAIFTGCDSTGAGESSPGPGGGLYVGKEGSVLFDGALEMSSIYITDDSGGNGGAIYNLGKVNITGSTRFESIRARDGGALYNAAGAEFRFMNEASVVFIECDCYDGTGSALYNGGYFEFSGPALVVELNDETIYIASTGETVLSEDSVFWDTDGSSGPTIIVESGGELDIPSSVSFINVVDADCATVYYEEDGTCLD